MCGDFREINSYIMDFCFAGIMYFRISIFFITHEIYECDLRSKKKERKFLLLHFLDVDVKATGVAQSCTLELKIRRIYF